MENINLGTAQMLGSRQDQQDAYGISDKDDTGFVEYGGVLAVIADGIGGHAHGAEASHKGVGAFIRHYQVNPQKPNIPQALFHALIHANRAVLEFAESQGEAENCGTTLLAVALHPNSSALYWISVGDSRMYFWRDGELALFTADANYGSHLIKKFARGTASRDDLYAEENPHRLTSFLGVKKLGRIDRNIRPFPLHQGDKVLICTDGIYQAVSIGELSENLMNEPQAACDKIIQAIADKNFEHQDNATLAVLSFGRKEAKKLYIPKVEMISHKESSEGQESTIIKSRHVGRRLGIGVLLLMMVLAVLGAVWLFQANKEPTIEEQIKSIEIQLPNFAKPEKTNKLPPKR